MLFHPITRVLAALVCIPCVVLAVICLFHWQAFKVGCMYALGAFVFGTIAVTGELNKRGRLREELYRAAGRYKRGEITLDEYAEVTKKIVDG